MEAIQSLPKRPERPPVYLVTKGEVVEKPDKGEILDELHLSVIAPLRVVGEILLSETMLEDINNYPRGRHALGDMFQGLLKRWDQLYKYL